MVLIHPSVKKFLYILSAAGTAVGGGYLIKDYMGGPKYEGKEKLTGKVVIVTGANTGIGKETAMDLAKREAKVIMACRNMDKCEMTRREIVIESKNKYIYCRECDLASQESIRKFVDQFTKEHTQLHILINNGGVMRCPQSFTKDGIEMQLGVNHMGHFLLTNLLLDMLKDSAPSRVVTVSSAAHLRGKIKVKDLNSMDKYDPAEAYCQSKLANVLFTRELANRLKGTDVSVNAVHPGIVDTDIVRHMSFYNNFFTKIFIKPFSWLFIKSPKHGAQTVLYAALDPNFQDKSGCYISDYKISDVSEEAKDDKLARWLWQVSEKWTRLSLS